MRPWLPLKRDGALASFFAVVLFGALVVFGLGVSRMPSAVVAPGLPGVGLLSAAVILCAFGLWAAFRASRSNYVRSAYAFPRVLATFVLVSGFFTLAFTIGRVFRSEIEIDLSADIEWAQFLISIVGGQTAWIVFLVLFSLLNREVAEVDRFRRLRGEISSLFEDMVVGKKNYETFSKELKGMEDPMKSLGDLANSIAPHLDSKEQAYARDFAEASETLAEQFAGNPGKSGKLKLLNRNRKALKTIGVSTEAAKDVQNAGVA